MKKYLEILKELNGAKFAIEDKYDLTWVQVDEMRITADMDYASMSCWRNEEPTFKRKCDIDQIESYTEFEESKQKYAEEVETLKRLCDEWKETRSE